MTNPKLTPPKISEEAAAEIAEAARQAYSHPHMDAFMDEVFREVANIRREKRAKARGQKSLSE